MPSRLKSSLLNLDDVAPADDYEMPAVGSSSRNGKQQDSAADDEDDESDDEVDDDSVGVEANRDHYENVGPSSRRRKANLTEESGGTLDQGKYKAREARWSEMNGSGDDNDSDDDDDDDDDDEESIASASGSGSEAEEPAAPRRSRKSVRFNDTNDADNAPPRSQTLLSSLSNQSTLMSTMRDQAKEDARKGKAIKAQMAFWQKALENRIKLDKILGGRGIGRIQPSVMSDLIAGCDDQGSNAWALTSSLLDHSAALLETQGQMLLASGNDNDDDDNAALEMDDELQTQFEQIIGGAKRKRGEDDIAEASTSLPLLKKQHLEQVSATLAFGTQILQPFTSSTLNSHSVRSANKSSSSAGGSDSNKFNGSSSGDLKALDQSIPKQIEIAMSGESGQRLIDRTKKYRGQGDRIGSRAIASAEANADDRETFDDSDFYSSLLRSLIESSSAGLSAAHGNDDDPSNTPLPFHPRTNTKMRGVDTRASKGRKLRYEVIEKVANFMPRIGNREKWTDEMKERLYAILPGGTGSGAGGDAQDSGDEDEDEDDGEGDVAAPATDLGGLRLFG